MSKVLAMSNKSDCHRWNLPDLDDSGSGDPARETAGSLDGLQQQAYQEGFERGLKEGLDTGRQMMTEKAGMFEKLMCSLAQPFEDLDKKVEDELLALVFAIARQLVGNEIKTNPERVMAIVHEAVSMLPSASRHLQLHLNPEDAQLVHELLPASDSERQWQIIEDVSMDRGGCRVATDTSRVDATMETRLNNIIAALADGEFSEDAPE